MKEKNTDFKT